MTDNLKNLIVLHSALHAIAQYEIIGFIYNCTMKDFKHLHFFIILSKLKIKYLVINLCINMVTKLLRLI